MITRDQANEVADSLLEQPRKELGTRQDKRSGLKSAGQRRRESPVFPAFIAAITVYGALDYTESGFFL